MDTYQNKIESLFIDGMTKEMINQRYDDWAAVYEEDWKQIQGRAQYYTALKSLEHCPGSPDDVLVLDVGCGTGMVGKQLQSRGFTNIDGLDPSSCCLKQARQKGVYRELICDFLTQEPLDVPENTYAMLVTCGTFIKGHLQPECLPEMIRLVRPGGIICIVSRASSFNGKTVPEYRDIVTLMNKLEKQKLWKNIQWERLPDYHENCEGLAIVYEVL